MLLDNFKLIKLAMEAAELTAPKSVINALLLAVVIISKNKEIAPCEVDRMLKEIRAAVYGLNLL